MEIIGIWTYMITLYIRPQDWVPFFLNEPVNDVIIGGTLLAVMPKWISEHRRLYLPHYVFLIIFLALVFFSNAINGLVYAGFEVFVDYVKRAMVFLMFILVLDSTRRLKWVLFIMMALATLLAIQGIEQVRTGVGWAGQPLMQGYEDIRITWIGDWDGPNVLALLFVLGSAIALEFMFGPYRLWYRLLNTFCVAILLYGVYLTNSRGGVLALLAVVSFYCAKRFSIRYAIIVALALAILASSFFPSRMAALDAEESSAHERLWVWEQGLTLLRENPLFGVGKGQFTKRSYNRLLAHNNYLQVAAELGFPGYFCWLALFYCSIKWLFQIQRQKAENEDQYTIISLARAMLVLLVGFSVATFFVTMELDILFVLWALSSSAILLGREMFPNAQLRLSTADMAAIFTAAMAILFLVYAATTL